MLQLTPHIKRFHEDAIRKDERQFICTPNSVISCKLISCRQIQTGKVKRNQALD
jgi:hypothetical protein